MDTKNAGVVARVGAVLRAASQREPAGSTTSQVAQATGLARPTVHRLLTALLAEGLVDRTERGRWLLGPELYLLGSAAASRYDVTAVAQPYVRRLSVATGESAFFSARRGDETVCLLREDGSFPIRSHVLYEGIRFPLGVASAGLAILAYLPDADVEDLLAREDLTQAYGESHRPERIRARVEQTRRDGYATNPGLIVEGSWGMGAAVFDRAERPRWALSLTGIEQRFGAERRRRELGPLLLRAAHELGAALRQG
ncbi:IclR family transcriptional regulator [Nocardioides sp.]|uniref:IclR family transcriptional regulator n=1 Tax=Nocardioides sp. TaxID=35761 RepID=UPI0039E548B4